MILDNVYKNEKMVPSRHYFHNQLALGSTLSSRFMRQVVTTKLSLKSDTIRAVDYTSRMRVFAFLLLFSSALGTLASPLSETPIKIIDSSNTMGGLSHVEGRDNSDTTP